MKMKSKKINIWQTKFIMPALKESLEKLNPLIMMSKSRDVHRGDGNHCNNVYCHV